SFPLLQHSPLRTFELNVTEPAGFADKLAVNNGTVPSQPKKAGIWAFALLYNTQKVITHKRNWIFFISNLIRFLLTRFSTQGCQYPQKNTILFSFDYSFGQK
ncbi:MAG: hypothetical protein ACKPFK_09380, partial [Dolichospermum sp.]